jgi:general nucleoside transport system permease protein
MAAETVGWWGVPLAIAAGTMRGGTPFLFVSLGECLTEKSGKINLGLEGTLLTGAMSAYAISYLTGSHWLCVDGGGRWDGPGVDSCLADATAEGE